MYTNDDKKNHDLLEETTSESGEYVNLSNIQSCSGLFISCDLYWYLYYQVLYVSHVVLREIE